MTKNNALKRLEILERKRQHVIDAKRTCHDEARFMTLDGQHDDITNERMDIAERFGIRIDLGAGHPHGYC